MNFSSQSTGTLVDTFGALKAQAANVSAELADIKAVLIDRHGEGKHEGELFRLSLSNSLRSTTDKDAVILALAKAAGFTDKRLDNLIASHTSLADNWVARSAARVTK
jgi:hypothetical protein